MKKIILAVLLFITHTSAFSQKSPFEQLHTEIQSQQLKNDVDTWMDWIHSIHPDLSYTIKNIDQFYQTVAQIKDSIYSSLTVLEFWKRISVLNSQLSDGHLIVGHINAPIVMNYLKNGGTFFPFEVVFNKNELFISSNQGGSNSEYKGYKITHINNRRIDSILAPMLLRINGDSDTH